jgi:hypothetical protein
MQTFDLVMLNSALIGTHRLQTRQRPKFVTSATKKADAISERLCDNFTQTNKQTNRQTDDKMPIYCGAQTTPGSHPTYLRGVRDPFGVAKKG